MQHLSQQLVRVICGHGVQTQHALFMRDLNHALAVLQRTVGIANSGGSDDSRRRGGTGQLFFLNDIDGERQITIYDNESADDGIVANTAIVVENDDIDVRREDASSQDEICFDGEITVDDNPGADDGVFANI